MGVADLAVPGPRSGLRSASIAKRAASSSRTRILHEAKPPSPCALINSVQDGGTSARTPSQGYGYPCACTRRVAWAVEAGNTWREMPRKPRRTVAADHRLAGRLLLVAVVDEEHHRSPAERAFDAEHLRLALFRHPGPALFHVRAGPALRDHAFTVARCGSRARRSPAGRRR